MEITFTDTVEAVQAKEDKTSDGKFQRYLIGKPGDPISEAIYLDPSQEHPKALMIGFQR
jgi:hypothetical protein